MPTPSPDVNYYRDSATTIADLRERSSKLRKDSDRLCNYSHALRAKARWQVLSASYLPDRRRLAA